jgi:SAM-dependent methyltransferase
MTLQKTRDYSHTVRHDLLGLIPPGVQTVLSVGCAAGVTERLLKQRGKRVIGVDLCEEWAREAQAYLDQVFVGDVESLSLPIPEGSVDCILYGDVLEHLRRPEAVLRCHRKFLTDGGVVVISVPNMRFWEVVFDLAIRGDWPYTEAGILDATHLRVFTPRSTIRMLKGAGFEVLKVRRTCRVFERRARHTRLARVLNTRLAHVLARGPLRDFLTYQLLVLARKQPS